MSFDARVLAMFHWLFYGWFHLRYIIDEDDIIIMALNNFVSRPAKRALNMEMGRVESR